MSIILPEPTIKIDQYTTQFTEYKSLIDNGISSMPLPTKGPTTLYSPFEYLLKGGGKRLRPILTLVAANVCGGNILMAVPSCLAIEILHNFTLVHDDIMDKAPLRRGRETVHAKWNEAVGILTGDVMMGYAYKLLLEYKSHQNFARILDAFTTGLIEVCEGQAYDLEFHSKENVTIEDYLQMIEKKTAKLLVMSATIGGLIGNSSDTDLKSLQKYALNIGIGFQIQDDYLDLYADQSKLGKQIGKDLIEGKKTFQIVSAIQRSTKKEHIEFLQYYCTNKGISQEEIPIMKQLFDELEIEKVSKLTEMSYFQKAQQSIVLFSDSAKNELEYFLNLLTHRLF